MKIRVLKTRGEVIDELGGTVAFGERVGRSKQQVSNMRRGDTPLPPKSYLVVMAALKKRGCTAPAALFDMAEPDKVSA
jgi:hypothetical protein